MKGMCIGAQVPTEARGIESPGNCVTGSWEPPDVGARYQILILWKIRKHS